MKIQRVWEMPHKYTFRMKSISSLLRSEMSGVWADPFAGQTSPAQIRNDADLSNEAEHHLDGLDFLKSLGNASVDGVLFDPPYSVEQALRKYKPKQNGTAGRAEYWARCKDEIARIVKPRGKAICFGWDSTGIGKTRGFALEEVLLICHGACHNDTIVTVERNGPEEKPSPQQLAHEFMLEHNAVADSEDHKVSQ
jgi:DNA modification methylase